jgi:hypothetical protein
MDNLDRINLEKVVIKVLQDYRDFIGNDPDSNIQLIIDQSKTHYLLIETGWQNNRRIYGNLIHIEIVNNKIWIQQDGTEAGIANELVQQGIPPQQIVLAFKAPERREITDFAVS